MAQPSASNVLAGFRRWEQKKAAKAKAVRRRVAAIQRRNRKEKAYAAKLAAKYYASTRK